ncbi:MAG TPA: hypothetical protein PLH94_14605 [Fimbriimonadaceae bacterium]|nr:hypothetical protein [Fimbriimonadaceae bacterium]
MTETPETPVEERRIRTAEDLLLALRDPDLTVRAALLKSILEQPDASLRFGPFQGVDLIDELIAQTFQTLTPPYRHLLTATLAVLDDPRVPVHFRRLMTYFGEPELLRVIEGRLEREPIEPGLAQYRSLAMQDDSELHTEVAANLLSRAESLDPRLAIRVSVANGVRFDGAPAVTTENAAAWVEELNGKFGRAASLLIEDRGVQAFLALIPAWNSLTEINRAWLVDWGSRAHPLDAVPIIRAAIHDQAEPVVVAGLRAVESLGPMGTLFHPEIAHLVDHESPRVRTLALSAGAPLADPRSRLETESAPDVRAEILVRLRHGEGAGAIDTLVAELHHEDYRVRVQAMTELVCLGDAVEEQAKSMVLGDDRDLKAAGTNLLLAMGHQEWLEAHLLG